MGVTRVGDLQEWFVGPHVPGIDPIPDDGKFKDGEHKIRRCAAVSHLYAFDADGTVLGEIDTTDSRFDVNWTVHVANKSQLGSSSGASTVKRGSDFPTVQRWESDSSGQLIHNYAHINTMTKLTVDWGETHVNSANAASVDLRGEFFGSKNEVTPVHLGEIHNRWDWQAGRLGKRWPCLVDTMFDGHVTVKVKPTGSGTLYPTKHRATVIAAPPHFANGHHCPTNLYELIEDAYERKKRKDQGDSYDVGEVDYYKHIDPMFQRMYMNSCTNFRANEGHGPRKAGPFLDNPDLSNKDTEFP